MKAIKYVLFTLIFSLCISFAVAQDRTGETIYQEAIYHLEGTGDYDRAITHLERIVDEFPDNKSLAARALLHLGIAQEKLGKQEAKQSFRRILDDYDDQREIALEARSRLLSLEQKSRQIDLSGMAVRQIWDGDGVDPLGSPSPDGRYLSFTDWTTGDLAIRDLTTGENRLLTNEASSPIDDHALFSIFSPDGQSIAYAWWNNPKLVYELRILNLETGESRVLFSDETIGYVHPYDWSPDGQQIAFLAMGYDEGNRIKLINIDDGSIKELFETNTRTMTPENFNFTPDGRFLTYEMNPSENRADINIFIIDLEQDTHSVLVDNPADYTLFGWAPNGEYLLFYSDRTGTYDLYLQEFSDGSLSGNPQMIISDMGQEVYPMGFTEGGSYYFGRRMGERDVYISSIDFESGHLETDPQRLSQTHYGRNRNPEWTSDGQYIAWISDRAGLYGGTPKTIVIQSTTSGQKRTIDVDLMVFQTPRWSPDGARFVTRGTDNDRRSGIFIINASTGEIEQSKYMDRFSDNPSYYNEALWSPDGNSVYFRKTVNHRDHIVSDNHPSSTRSIIRWDLESGRETELYKKTLIRSYTISNLTLSNSDETLAFLFRDAENDMSGIKLLNTNSGDIETLHAFDGSIMLNALHSFRDGEIMFSLRPNGDVESNELELAVIDVDSETIRKLEAFKDFENFPNHVRLHPYEDTIVFNLGDISKFEIWKIENFLPEMDQ